MDYQAPEHAYAEKMAEIECLMDILKRQLDSDDHMARQEGIDWGHVGTLGYVSAKLDELTDFLGDADD